MEMASIDRIGGGRLVHATIQGQPVVGLKAVRIGKDFVNYYVVPLEPRPQGPLHLVYFDYEAMLSDCNDHFRLQVGSTLDRGVPEVGDILVNPRGTFLKVQEHMKDVTMFAYVDILNGEIRRHQERGVTGVFGWSVNSTP
ncbi:MAG: hypothetical protein ABT940_04890 [Alphaproteobacteria bacterium]